MNIAFLLSVIPVTENHLCNHNKGEKQELAEGTCCQQEETSCCSSEENEEHNHHEDHDCTPQCHCKCFSPHFFIPAPLIENVVAETYAQLSAKPITFVQSDYAPGIFQPPRFI